MVNTVNLTPRRQTSRHTCEGLCRLRLASKSVWEGLSNKLIDVGRPTVDNTILWAGTPGSVRLRLQTEHYHGWLHSFLSALDYGCNVTSSFKFLPLWCRCPDGLKPGIVTNPVSLTAFFTAAGKKLRQLAKHLSTESRKMNSLQGFHSHTVSRSKEHTVNFNSLKEILKDLQLNK